MKRETDGRSDGGVFRNKEMFAEPISAYFSDVAVSNMYDLHLYLQAQAELRALQSREQTLEAGMQRTHGEHADTVARLKGEVAAAKALQQHCEEERVKEVSVQEKVLAMLQEEKQRHEATTALKNEFEQEKAVLAEEGERLKAIVGVLKNSQRAEGLHHDDLVSEVQDLQQAVSLAERKTRRAEEELAQCVKELDAERKKTAAASIERVDLLSRLHDEALRMQSAEQKLGESERDCTDAREQIQRLSGKLRTMQEERGDLLKAKATLEDQLQEATASLAHCEKTKAVLTTQVADLEEDLSTERTIVLDTTKAKNFLVRQVKELHAELEEEKKRRTVAEAGESMSSTEKQVAEEKLGRKVAELRLLVEEKTQETMEAAKLLREVRRKKMDADAELESLSERVGGLEKMRVLAHEETNKYVELYQLELKKVDELKKERTEAVSDRENMAHVLESEKKRVSSLEQSKRGVEEALLLLERQNDELRRVSLADKAFDDQRSQDLDRLLAQFKAQKEDLVMRVRLLEQGNEEKDRMLAERQRQVDSLQNSEAALSRKRTELLKEKEELTQRLQVSEEEHLLALINHQLLASEFQQTVARLEKLPGTLAVEKVEWQRDRAVLDHELATERALRAGWQETKDHVEQEKKELRVLLEATTTELYTCQMELLKTKQELATLQDKDRRRSQEFQELQMGRHALLKAHDCEKDEWADAQARLTLQIDRLKAAHEEDLGHVKNVHAKSMRVLEEKHLVEIDRREKEASVLKEKIRFDTDLLLRKEELEDMARGAKAHGGDTSDVVRECSRLLELNSGLQRRVHSLNHELKDKAGQFGRQMEAQQVVVREAEAEIRTARDKAVELDAQVKSLAQERLSVEAEIRRQARELKHGAVALDEQRERAEAAEASLEKVRERLRVLEDALGEAEVEAITLAVTEADTDATDGRRHAQTPATSRKRTHVHRPGGGGGTGIGRREGEAWEQSRMSSSSSSSSSSAVSVDRSAALAAAAAAERDRVLAVNQALQLELHVTKQRLQQTQEQVIQLQERKHQSDNNDGEDADRDDDIGHNSIFNSSYVDGPSLFNAPSTKKKPQRTPSSSFASKVPPARGGGSARKRGKEGMEEQWGGKEGSGGDISIIGEEREEREDSIVKLDFSDAKDEGKDKDGEREKERDGFKGEEKTVKGVHHDDPRPVVTKVEVRAVAAAEAELAEAETEANLSLLSQRQQVARMSESARDIALAAREKNLQLSASMLSLQQQGEALQMTVSGLEQECASVRVERDKLKHDLKAMGEEHRGNLQVE